MTLISGSKYETSELQKSNFDYLLKIFENQNYEEVISLYENATQAPVTDVASLKIIAASYQKHNRANDELRVLSKVMELDPLEYQAYFNAGVVHLEQQDFKTAVIYFKTASILMPNNADALTNVGICYKEMGDLAQATQQYKLALNVDPNHEKASLNLGNIFAKSGDKDSALKCYLNALKAEPTNLDTQFNLAALFLENGDVLQAAANFYHLLTSNPTFEKAGLSFQQLCCQIDDTEANEALASYFENEAVLKKLSLFRLFHVTNAIDAFKRGDFAHSTKSLEASDGISNQSFQPVLTGIEADQHFCNAYSIFLSSLINEPRDIALKDAPSIFHIGESHCLSFAHRDVSIDGCVHRIQPKLCLGIKAFHLAQSENNKYKSLFNHNFTSIPQQSNVFISIGEIDCRPDEGIIEASKKTGASIEHLIEETVFGYVEHLHKINCSMGHRISLLNVPAPVKKAKYTSEQNKVSAEVVEIFNKVLENHTRDKQFGIINVYSKTLGKTGMSNGIYHCDDTHLGYKALEILQNSVEG